MKDLCYALGAQHIPVLVEGGECAWLTTVAERDGVTQTSPPSYRINCSTSGESAFSSRTHAGSAKQGTSAAIAATAHQLNRVFCRRIHSEGNVPLLRASRLLLVYFPEGRSVVAYVVEALVPMT